MTKFNVLKTYCDLTTGISVPEGSGVHYFICRRKQHCTCYLCGRTRQVLRTKYRRVGTAMIPALWPFQNLLCSPLVHAFSNPAPWSLLTKLSSKSPCFIKCQTRCQNLNMAEASQSQRTCEAISDACMHLSLGTDWLPAQSKSMLL